MQAIEVEYDFCLLIPCYNNTEGLLKSLESIHYTSSKFFVLVVDDGSEEPVSESVLKKSLTAEFPLHVLRLQKNAGIIHALNTGLQWIQKNLQTKYIARLDCGDTCTSDRFYKQVQYLDAHQDVALLGSWCIFKSADEKLGYKYKTPLTYKAICREMHFRNVFIHPTVMFRFSVIETCGMYPLSYPHGEDYAFFWKILKRYKGAVLDEFLTICEINTKGISLTNKSKQLNSRRRIVSTFASHVGLKMLGLLRLMLLRLFSGKLILKIKRIIFQK
jgi:glycosyltransferase involved in cell wall biosynthesis